MISAKDEFFLERENLNELNQLIQGSDLTQAEIEKIEFGAMDESEFERLKMDLTQRQITPLEKIRRGITCSAKEISMAVLKKANETFD